MLLQGAKQSNETIQSDINNLQLNIFFFSGLLRRFASRNDNTIRNS